MCFEAFLESNFPVSRGCFSLDQTKIDKYFELQIILFKNSNYIFHVTLTSCLQRVFLTESNCDEQAF